MAAPQTLFARIWQRHAIAELGDGFTLLHVDRHVVPELNGAAFEDLARRGLMVRNPELTFATPDHTMSTAPGPAPEDNTLVAALRANAARHRVRFFAPGEIGHGIVHVITPEQGIAQPGMTITIGDSHTCTNGALGALAWGVGQGELAHILATQTVIAQRPRTMRVRLEGTLPPGIGGKDLILFLIARLGVQEGVGHAVEYAGSAIRALAMEDRFTLCNMSVEWGARFGLIAPDDTVFSWLHGRPFAPAGAMWDRALADWRSLPSDDGARFDVEHVLDVTGMAPQVSWGNSLDAVLPVDGAIPDPAAEPDAAKRGAMRAALDYMALQPGAPIAGTRIDRVFIGSCTNSRITDLRAAAAVVRGRRVAPHVRAWVVPGSEQVRRDAEAEGLAAIFADAGFEWRRPGCSMCLGANGDIAAPGERTVSTTNRNFTNRQGPGTRTHVAGPALAAASALAGCIADPRRMEN